MTDESKGSKTEIIEEFICISEQCEFCALHYRKMFMNNICYKCIDDDHNEELDQLRKANVLIREHNILELLKEIKQLRKDKETWQKVCAFERKKWQAYVKVYPGLISYNEKEHLRSLDELAGDK